MSCHYNGQYSTSTHGCGSLHPHPTRPILSDEYSTARTSFFMPSTSSPPRSGSNGAAATGGTDHKQVVSPSQGFQSGSGVSLYAIVRCKPLYPHVCTGAGEVIQEKFGTILYAAFWIFRSDGRTGAATDSVRTLYATQRL